MMELLPDTDLAPRIDTPVEELRAISLAIRGDPEGFEFLYHENKKKIYARCLKLTGDSDTAEDLVQETFLQAFRYLPTFRGTSRFSTWLYRIATNNAFMRMRRAKTRVVEVSVERSDNELEEEHANNNRPLELVPERPSCLIERIQLERAIAALPPGYKSVYILREIEGYEYTEIAELLGCSVGNVKSQMHKARTKLRKLLLGLVRITPHTVGTPSAFAPLVGRQTAA